MEIVSDASAFLAVILGESGGDWVVNKTLGCTIVAPEVLPYEIGNALVAVGRRGRLNDREIMDAFEISGRIPVKLMPVQIRDAMKIALKHGIYAYDAYYLQCCIENEMPLLTLDKKMLGVAGKLEIETIV